MQWISGTFGFEALCDEARLKQALVLLQSRYGFESVELGVFDERNRRIAYAGSAASGGVSNINAQNRGAMVGKLFFNEQDVAAYTLSVQEGSHDSSWMLRAVIDARALDEIVPSAHAGERGAVFLLQKGRTFPVALSVADRLTEDRLSADRLPDEVVANLSRHAETGNDEPPVIECVDRSGLERLYAAGSIQGTDWWIILQQDASAAYSQFSRIRTVAVVLLLAIGFLLAANAFSLSKKLVRKIEEADKKKQRRIEQMYQTSKLASIGELAAGIAHEINNPVAIMVEEAGWINDLLEEEEFARGKNLNEFGRALDQIKSQGERCKAITQKLLSFARESGFRMEKVRLIELIGDVLDIMAKRSFFEKVRIDLNVQKDLPELSLPRIELQQVLVNLINNAVDAMKGKEGTLFLSAGLERDHLWIEVADDGCGIPEQHLQRIFDPFFTTKPVGQGTGLGLSICYGIIKKMGGSIQVENLVDRGASFRIRIPREALV